MRLLDILHLVGSVLDLLLNLVQPFRPIVVQPLVTVTMLMFLYAGWHVRDEGSVAAGLEVAFVDTSSFRAEHLRELEGALLRTELRQASQTDRLIDELPSAVLPEAPGAARARLDVIHNGVTGVTGTAPLRYAVTNSIAAGGHSAGELMTNQALSDWSGFLPSLVADRCQIRTVDHSANIASGPGWNPWAPRPSWPIRSPTCWAGCWVA